MSVWVARIGCRDLVPPGVAGSGVHCLLFCFEGVFGFLLAALSSFDRGQPFRWRFM